jgi:hypothetical protein
MKTACLALIAVALLLTASVVPACEKAGPNTHLGTVVALDVSKGLLTITDAETRRNLSFVAAAEVLQGVAMRDQVAVAYAREGERLRATSVRKLGG